MPRYGIDAVNRWYVPRGRRSGLHRAVLGILLAAGLGAAPWAAPAPKAARATLLVVPFDLFDFSLDQRPGTVGPLRHWVRELPRQLRRELSASGRFRVIGPRRIRGEWRKVADDYAHPTSCLSCMVDLGRHVGADYVVVGQVHKLSNLITYYQVQVDRVSTSRTVYRANSRADGANSNAMWRRIARNMAGGIEHSRILSEPGPVVQGAASGQ